MTRPIQVEPKELSDAFDLMLHRFQELLATIGEVDRLCRAWQNQHDPPIEMWACQYPNGDVQMNSIRLNKHDAIKHWTARHGQVVRLLVKVNKVEP